MKEALIKEARQFLELGFSNIMRDPAKRLDFNVWHERIGKPLTRKNCSSCLSQAFYGLQSKIQDIENGKIKINTMSTAKKYKFNSNIVNYRSRVDNKVYYPNTLTDEAAKAMIEKTPQLLGTVIIEIEQLKKAPAKKKKVDE